MNRKEREKVDTRNVWDKVEERGRGKRCRDR